MNRWLLVSLVVLALNSGCNKSNPPDGRVGSDAAAPGNPQQVAGGAAVQPDNGPIMPEIARSATQSPEQKAADNKYKELKSPLSRLLMSALDNVSGESSEEMDLTRKSIRENDAILDKASRDKWINIKIANTPHAAVKIHPQKIVARSNKDNSTAPSQPAGTGPATTSPPASFPAGPTTSGT